MPKLRQQRRLRAFATVTVGENASPLCKQLVALINRDKIKLYDFCKAVGIAEQSFYLWRHNRINMHILSVEACFNYFGHTLLAVPMEEANERRERSIVEGQDTPATVAETGQ